MAGGASSSGNCALCKRCKSKVINGIKCQNCSSYFHVSCAKLCGKFSEDKTVIVCCEKEIVQTDIDTDSAFYDAIEETSTAEKMVDPRIISYIIKQKDIIIKELNDKINILNNQIELMNKKAEVKENTNNEQKTKEVITSVKSDSIKMGHMPRTKTISEHSVKTDNKQSNKFIKKTQLSADLMKVQTQLKCNEIINLVNEESQQEVSTVRSSNSLENKIADSEWQKVNHRRSRKTKTIVGKNTEIQIKGVPKLTHLHVYRVKIGTTTEELTGMLKLSFPEVTCEAITPKYPNLYTSFKITIYENNFKKAMDPEVWPEGACVNRFFQLRQKTKPEQ